MRPSKKVGIVLGVLLLALPALGADLAILHNGFSIRHERRETVGSATRLYLGGDKGYIDIATNQIERFEKDLSPAVVPAALSARAPTVAAVVVPARMAKPQNLKPQDLNEVINTISDRHHIDPDFISSVIHAESGFNPRAVSPKGAQGLMQLMPGTASKLGVSNAFDPRANVEGGTRYLTELLQRYNFDVIKALAAYNAGPLRVQQYGGVPPYQETRAYVARIVRDYNRKKIAQRKAAAASARNNRNQRSLPPPAVARQASLPPALASQASP
ncbi:MAG: lytic transglycosylase domain-containing protein [Terriglobales bacterium]